MSITPSTLFIPKSKPKPPAYPYPVSKPEIGGIDPIIASGIPSNYGPQSLIGGIGSSGAPLQENVAKKQFAARGRFEPPGHPDYPGKASAQGDSLLGGASISGGGGSPAPASDGGGGGGIADWFSDPALPDGGLLGGRGQNRLSLIGDMLTGASKGYISGLQGPTPGMALGGAFMGASDALSAAKQKQYDMLRQQTLDEIAMKNADKNTQPKNSVVAPGGVLLDPTGKELYRNPAAEKVDKPDKPSTNAEIIAKMNDPNLSPEERAGWQGIYKDMTRAPQGPQVNIQMPKFFETDEGIVQVDPQTGESRLARANPPKPPRDLTPTETRIYDDAKSGLVASTNTIGSLEEALKLNDLAISAPGEFAGNAATMLSAIGDPKQYENTSKFQNLIQSSIIPNLKAVFGSQPTEGERAALMDIEGALFKPPAVRAEVINRAIRLAKAKEGKHKEDINALENRTYGSPGSSGGASAPAPVRRKYNPATGKIE